MKLYLRIAVVAVVVLAILLGLFAVLHKATAPESAIIAGEKQRLSGSFDRDRAAKDPIYAGEFQDRMRFLEYQQAVAYNKENEPDSAVPILEKLITDEQAANRGGISRRSRSYLREADYYEALQTAYSLKHDEAAMERAIERRNELTARAELAKRRDRTEEGKSMGVDGE